MHEPTAVSVSPLPVIRCPSLRRLAELTLREQRGRDDDPNFALKGEAAVAGAEVRLTDLLGVELEDKRVAKLFARQPFAWEEWDLAVDGEAAGSGAARYEFALDLSRVVIGTVRGRPSRPAGSNQAWAQFGGAVKFERTRFAGPVDFQGVQFLAPAEFGNANFEGELLLTGALFGSLVSFGGARFGGKVNLSGVQFAGRANLWGAYFEQLFNAGGAIFAGPAEFGFAEFGQTAYFGVVQFEQEASFEEVRFHGIAQFEQANFGGAGRFGEVTFGADAYFTRVTVGHDLVFAGASCEGSMLFDGVELGNRLPSHWFDFTDVAVKAKVSFNLAQAFEREYRRVNLGLYNSNIAYFCCDDYEFHEVSLFWKPIKRDQQPTDAQELAEAKTGLERYLHELRIKRRILQDMNWGDVADECYAEIMDQQLQLKRLEAQRRRFGRRRRLATLWLAGAVFGGVFGWGIRLRKMAWAAIGWVLLFGGIFFAMGYEHVQRVGEPMMHWAGQALAFSLEAFLVLSVPNAPDMPTAFEVVGIVEAAGGYVLCTVFVVVLARKFMRL